MNVRVLGVAQAEATDIADWYNRRSSGLGDRFLAALDRVAADLARHPRLHGRAPRSPRGREVRYAPLGRFPYIAVYEVTATEVVVLSVRHVRRRPKP